MTKAILFRYEDEVVVPAEAGSHFATSKMDSRFGFGRSFRSLNTAARC